MTWKLFLTVLMPSTCFLSTWRCLFFLMSLWKTTLREFHSPVLQTVTLWKSTLRVFHSQVLRTIRGVRPPGVFKANGCCYQQFNLVLSMLSVPCRESECQSTVRCVNYGQISLPLYSRSIHPWEGNRRDWHFPSYRAIAPYPDMWHPYPQGHDSTGPLGYEYHCPFSYCAPIFLWLLT